MSYDSSLVKEVRNQGHLTVMQFLADLGVRQGIYSNRLSTNDPYKTIYFYATTDEVAIVLLDYHANLTDDDEAIVEDVYFDCKEELSFQLLTELICNFAVAIKRNIGSAPRIWGLLLTDQHISNYDEVFFECERMGITFIDNLLQLQYPVQDDETLPGFLLVNTYLKELSNLTTTPEKECLSDFEWESFE